MQARQEAEGAATGAEHIPSWLTSSSWHCVRCGKRANSWQDLAAGRCGAVQAGRPEASHHAALAHEAFTRAISMPDVTRGHALVEAAPLTACVRCGAYESRAKALRLRQPCCPSAPVANCSWTLGQIFAGRHPGKSEDLAPLALPTYSTIVAVTGWGSEQAAQARGAEAWQASQEVAGASAVRADCAVGLPPTTAIGARLQKQADGSGVQQLVGRDPLAMLVRTGATVRSRFKWVDPPSDSPWFGNARVEDEARDIVYIC